VTITSPEDGSSYDSDVMIPFAGSAEDLEDGDLSASLAWFSNIDGEIGTGASFQTTLSDGEHTITAEVVDTGGKTGSSSITVKVGSVQEPDTMSVTDIEMWYTRTGRNYNIYTRVTIGSDGQPVAGATVSISLNGSILLTGTTGSDGTVKLSNRTKSTGTYTSEVTDVAHPSFTWDSIPATQSLPVP
jgi:WD40 repeat protein